MMRLLTFAILLFFSGLALAQDPVISLDVSTKDDDSGKKLAGSTIEVYKDGKLFVTKQSASNGRVPLIDLPLGSTYKIVIKKEGYVAKVATLDGRFDYPEDLPPFVPFPIQTSLFRKVEGVDFKWLETTPMIKFELDQYGNQTWDKAYTNGMLKKIEDLKKQLAEKADEEAKKQADFDAYVKTADAANSKQEYETAIENYNKALEIFSDKADVKKKRDDAQKAWDALKASEETEKKFQEKMAAAKDKFTAKSYKEALTLYKEASVIKPSEALPKTRIQEIEKLLADEKAIEDKFNKFVADGDKAVGTEAYDDAISNYESALALKDDSAVKAKLEDAKKKKQEKADAEAAEKDKEEKYNKLIAEADKAFTAKTYEEAKTKYQGALDLKPGESHPSARLSEIDEILKKLKADEDAAKKLEADYKKLIEEGDASFNSENWQSAIDKYEAALKLKAGESHPTSQIAAAKKKLEEDAANKAQNEKYDKLMADASSLKDGKKYEEAIAKYKEALAVKPKETEPTSRIAEIEKIINDLAGEAAKEEKYKKHMADGNTAQSASNLEKALADYKSALTVKEGDTEAQKKIDEVNKLIKEKADAEANEKKFNDLVAAGDKGFADKSYTDAKVNYLKALGIKDDQSIKDKINQIDDLMAKNQDAAEQQAKYDAAIKKADAAYTAKSWEEALKNYEEAFAIKDEDYAKQRIASVKEKIAAEADAEAQAKQFTDLVADGDRLSGEKKYNEAIKKYSEAIKIKPDPNVSKKIIDLEELIKKEGEQNALSGKYQAKIKEADAAFNSSSWESAKTLYADAIDIKSDEEYPKNQLAEIDRIMKEESENEIEKQYQKILSVAQTKMDTEDYDKAIELYTRAKDMKPSDPLPQQKIDEIAKIKKQKEDELANKEAFEKKYKDLIASADGSLGSKSYEDALAKYKEALTMKPAETYPKDKIAEINNILGAQSAEAELDAKYKAALKKADDLFASDDFMEAKSAYQNALDIKSSEQYPKDQIALCDDKLKNQAESEIEKQYQKILTVAQEKMDQEDFEKAIELFTRAKDMKPSDPLPQQRIDEINQLLADRSSDADKRKKYDDLILQADNLFESKKWKEALEKYLSALDIIQSEQYPKDQVEKCRAGMKKGPGGNAQYDKLINKADEYFDAANYPKAKGLYERALTIKPSDPYPKKRLKEINDILNPPKEHIASSDGLKDYGPAVNERPIDIEAMLIEAEEQSRYYEYQKIYDTRQEAEDAKDAWADAGKEETFVANDHVEKLQINSEDLAVTGDIAREEVVIDTEELQVELAERKFNNTADQNNDIQFQNKKVTAMNIEIEESNFENDIPREEYLLDVERIKIENEETDRNESYNQENINQNDKYNIEVLEESHVSQDPGTDVKRQNFLVDVEDQQVSNINYNNENIWDQEDEVMSTKVETELMTDDIIANKLDDDIPREDNIILAEEIHLSYVERDKSNAESQYDENQGSNNYAENMSITIEKENFDNDKPREDAEVFVEDQTYELKQVKSVQSADQTDAIMDKNIELEDIVVDIEEHNDEMNKDRQGFEKELQKVENEITDYNGNLADENKNSSFDTKDYTETMNDTKTANDIQSDKDADKNADANQEAIEDFIEVTNDKNEVNNESLEIGEDYIETLKDIKLNEITPEMQNELGQKFPEGVTEESFSINDSNGLLKAYIVRRVVVNEGSGKVYEKTQTRYGHTSYTRNGEPISEYQWSDETSGLNRN